ncbi:MAG TPA: DMT family transporter [Acidimicrobiia bacterium]|nr:DMT family transporter [Acidimicrobiia bacterium]
MNRGSWAALWALSVGWGTVGVATRAALENGVGSLTIVAGRLVIATALVAAAQLFLRRRMSWDPTLVRTGTVMAIVGVAMPYVLFNYAYKYASAGFVGLMAALAPLGTAIFAHFLLPGERIGRRRLFGLSLAIAGVAVLLLAGDSGLAVGGRPSLAIAWSIPGVAAFSFSTVYAKRQTASLAGFDVLVVQFAVATALMLAPTFLMEGVPRLDAESWWLLVYLAIGSTVVPLMLFYWVLQRNTAAQTALVGFIVPLVAVIAGVVLMSEKVGTGLILGGAAIITGVIVADRSGRDATTVPA